MRLWSFCLDIAVRQWSLYQVVSKLEIRSDYPYWMGKGLVITVKNYLSYGYRRS